VELTILRNLSCQWPAPVKPTRRSAGWGNARLYAQKDLVGVGSNLRACWLGEAASCTPAAGSFVLSAYTPARLPPRHTNNKRAAAMASSSSAPASKRLGALRKVHQTHTEKFRELLEQPGAPMMNAAMLSKYFAATLEQHPDLLAEMTQSRTGPPALLDALLERDFPTLWARQPDALRALVGDMLNVVVANMEVRVLARGVRRRAACFGGAAGEVRPLRGGGDSSHRYHSFHALPTP
jgi:hypothetical protein